jgi:hypothetical protein
MIVETEQPHVPSDWELPLVLMAHLYERRPLSAMSNGCGRDSLARSTTLYATRRTISMEL